MASQQASEEAIHSEIEELEARFGEAKVRLRAIQAASPTLRRESARQPPLCSADAWPAPPSSPATHFLLLLSDSALPLGAAALPFVLAAHRDPGALSALDDALDAAAADVPPVSAHLAPLFGAVCALVGLGLRQTAYVFLLSHAKAVLSAAVRASVLDPYQAHRVLAGDQLQRIIDAVIDREWQAPVEEAGQSVPVMDLWIGRHELLYSRIFNS